MAEAGALSGAGWHRVSGLRPRIRAHVAFHRHGFRDQVWYVLEDRAAGRYYRFTPRAYTILGRMDGNSTVADIYEAVTAEPGGEDFDRVDMVKLLAQLHRAGVLHGDALPEIEEMVTRSETRDRRMRQMRFLNPLAIRIPVFDPERLISFTYPLVRPLLSVFGLILIAGLILYGATLAVMHWTELTGDLRGRLLNLQNAGLLLLAYPLVKLVHELGHAYAIKHGGGELHEMGVMMLVFMPVPYVDASAAAAFPNKWARAGVGAAGIIVELSLAAIALILWLELEPGLLRAFLFNVMLIGGVSTLLFNGNPLLKFDGYYVLSDIIEIPNLGQRANRYIRYLVMGRLFGSESVTSPVTARGEARWFFFYAIAAFFYRSVVMLTIVFFVAGQAFVLGVVLAAWAVVLMFGLPLFKALRALFTSPDLRARRGRALGISGATFAVAALGLGATPVPSVTIAEGVVSAGKGAPIVSEVTATVSRTLAQAEGHAAERSAVLIMTDPLLEARKASLEADLRVIESRLLGASINDTAEARILRGQKERAEADLARAVEQIAQLTITTEKEGSVHLLHRADLPGRLVHQGDVVGYSLDPASYEIEVVIPQSRIDLIGAGDGPIALRLATQPKRVIPAVVIRQTPSAITELPNAALSSAMGGQILTDPSDPTHIRTLVPVFRLTLASSQPLSSDLVGQKVFVRFDHGAEPLLAQAYRSIRQLFLERFNV